MKKIITPEEARNHRYKNVITRALGNRVDIEVEVGMDDLKPGDIYMICSDGLSGMVEDSVMTEILKTTPGLREAANRLVAAANEAGGHDNITVVLIRAVE
jgi:protein phosphatase